MLLLPTASEKCIITRGNPLLTHAHVHVGSQNALTSASKDLNDFSNFNALTANHVYFVIGSEFDDRTMRP